MALRSSGEVCLQLKTAHLVHRRLANERPHRSHQLGHALARAAAAQAHDALDDELQASVAGRHIAATGQHVGPIIL
eukprot:1015272-Pyramimonas_sp.AAC.1